MIRPGVWRPSFETPPEGVLLDVKIHDSSGIPFERTMTYAQNLWWYDYGTPNAIYVHFRPAYWRVHEAKS